MVVDWVISFLMAPPGSRNAAAIDNYPAILAGIVSKFPESAIALLNLAQDILCTVLPHVLSKTNCVHYGLLQLSPDGLRSPDTGKVAISKLP